MGGLLSTTRRKAGVGGGALLLLAVGAALALRRKKAAAALAAAAKADAAPEALKGPSDASIIGALLWSAFSTVLSSHLSSYPPIFWGFAC